MLTKTKEEICQSVNKIPLFAMEKGVAKSIDEFIDTILHYCSNKELRQTFVAAGQKILPDLKERKFKRSAAHLEKAIREVSDLLKLQELSGNSRGQRKARRLLKARLTKSRLLAYP